MNTHLTAQPHPLSRTGFHQQTGRILCVALSASTVLFGAWTAKAANIVWVTDANDPATGFFPPGSGFTDSGFVTLLQNAGHNVIRYNPPTAVTTLLSSDELTALNTNDLVIISRCVNSGIFQAGQGNQWNTAITKPLMDLSAFHARNSRLGWFAANEGADNTPTVLSAVLTGNVGSDAVIDYLFSGVAMNGTNTVSPFDETADRNSTPIPSAPVVGGIVYANGTYAQENSNTTPPARTTGNFIAGFPASTAVRAGADILGGYRMFFAAGSRESAAYPAAIPQYTSRENLTATGESIFLRAVQVALNNGAAPATDPNAPIVFVSQPTGATVARGGSVTLSVSVSGAAPRTIEWQRDEGDGVTFTNIPGASTIFSVSSITLSNLDSGDDNAKFRVVASNPDGTATSDVATLVVTPDTAAPVPLSAASLDGTSIGICFDEVVDPRPGGGSGGTAVDLFNYILTDANNPGTAIISVEILPDGRSLILQLNGPLSPVSTINIARVEDRFGNGIPDAGIDLVCHNLGFTAVEVGSPGPSGTNYACGTSSFTVGGGAATGGGASLANDIQPTAEHFRFVHKTVSGDFDARMRVASLTGTPDHLETTAKAILSARATADGNSPSVNVFVTPPNPGDNTFGATARTSAGALTSSNFVTTPYALNALPVPYPNAWLRITRAGDLFTTFQSSNGTDWSPLGNITVAMGPTALIGAGVSSHRNGRLATANFSDFSISKTPPSPTLTGLTYAAGSFSASFQTQNGVTYTIQYKDDLNAPTWQTLTTVPGDGTVKSFTDPGPAGSHRFYQVTVP